MAKKQPAIDPLNALATGPLENVIAAMLWKNRHREPSMTMVLKASDLQGMQDCCQYLKLVPQVVVLRPEGRPAVPAIPPRGNRPGIPAQAAEPPRPHVVVALVNKGTMDAILPLENNDEDAELLVREQHRRRMQSKAGFLVQAALRMSSNGDVSTSELRDIAECLQAFAGETE